MNPIDLQLASQKCTNWFGEWHHAIYFWWNSYVLEKTLQNATHVSQAPRYNALNLHVFHSPSASTFAHSFTTTWQISTSHLSEVKNLPSFCYMKPDVTMYIYGIHRLITFCMKLLHASGALLEVRRSPASSIARARTRTSKSSRWFWFVIFLQEARLGRYSQFCTSSAVKR